MPVVQLAARRASASSHAAQDAEPGDAPSGSLGPETAAPDAARRLRLTRHARRRAARRNVLPDAVAYALAYGRAIQRTGVTFYFLGARDIPAEDRRANRFSRLVGTVVLVAPDGEVVTVYRNRQALRTILKKSKCRLAAFAADWPNARLEDRTGGLAWRTA
jgi:hypothetical protein